MKDSQPFTSPDFGIFATGALIPAREYKSASKLAKGLPNDLPVLACLVTPAEWLVLQRPVTQTCFGFGVTPGGDDKLMTIRLQLGCVQTYWLADITDEEVWNAIDKWKIHKVVPFCFEMDSRGKTNAYFGVIPDFEGPLQIDMFRTGIAEDLRPGIWNHMGLLASSGLMKAQATTDIEGVRLNHVFVNALLTKRLKDFAKDTLMSEKPVFATSGIRGGAKVH